MAGKTAESEGHETRIGVPASDGDRRVSTRQHWESVYRSKVTTEVSWYSLHLEQSLRSITDVAPREARIIDVGGGASTLVDDLLDLGYRSLSVLDVSAAALGAARQRLGDRAEGVQWLEADITSALLPGDSFDLWHDRAVFHFLTEVAHREAYVANLRRSLAAGGTVVIATFSLDGPTRCSGLEVVRYSADSLARALGPDFEPISSADTTHTTPAGAAQRFVTCQFRKGV